MVDDPPQASKHMPAGFPCPNPTCPHLFPVDSVRGAAALKCPRCGSVFQFRARPAAPAAPPAKAPAPRPAPAAKEASPRATPLPLARPVATPAPVPPPPPPPAVALATPVAPAAAPVTAAPDNSSLAFNSSPEITVNVPAHLRRRGSSRWRLPLILLALAAGGGGVVAGFILLNKHFPGGQEAGGPEHRFDEHNFAFRLPGDPWRQDRGLQTALKVTLAWSRAEPVSYLALEFKDYGERLPGRGILLDEVLTRLRDYFGDLAWEPTRPATLAKWDRHGSLGGHPALVLDFLGVRDAVPYEGEVHILEYQGFVYWFITFAPQANRPKVEDEWAALRSGFSVLNKREGWRQKPRETAPFQGTGYALAYVKEIWTRRDREGFDDKAELVLEGRDPKADPEAGGSRAGRAAFLQVLVLDKQPDLKAAAEAVRKHVQEHEEAFLGKKLDEEEFKTVEDAKGQKREGPAAVGKAKGHVSKVRLEVSGGTRDRFFLLATVPVGERTVAVVCECEWKRHDYWEQEVNDLLATFKLVGE